MSRFAGQWRFILVLDLFQENVILISLKCEISMKGHLFPIIITVLLAGVAVAGDYFLKLASSCKSPFLNLNFAIGLGIYGLSAFGLVLVMPHLKLAYLGVWYCLTMVLCLCLLGSLTFDESLRPKEWLGVGFAVVSLLLLSRFT